MRLRDKTPHIGILTIMLIVTSLVSKNEVNASNGLIGEQGPYPPPVSTPHSVTGPYKIFLPLTSSEFPTPPTDSYYMFTTNDMWGLGCNLGTATAQLPGIQNRFVFLDFGNPNRDSNGYYGTQLFNQDLVTVNDINSSVYVFAQAFKYCLRNAGDYSSFLTIGVGTNSSGGSNLDLIATAHGSAWAQLVIDINGRLAGDSITTNAIAVGASNMEPGFNTYAITKKWVDGYRGKVGHFRLYNIGSADGCPLYYPPNDPYHNYYSPGACNNNWNQDQIYNVSWNGNNGDTWFIPEIYESVNEANSQQWYRIGLYANLSLSYRMTFEGSITQSGVCQQYLDRGDTTRWNLYCSERDNSPQEGYSELYNWINTHDQYDRMDNGMKWSTDIREYR